MFKDAAPGNQEVLVFEEQCLCDNVFVALQPVQSALIDDVPHDHVCVLKRRKKTKKRANQALRLICSTKETIQYVNLALKRTLDPVTSRAPSAS